MNVALAEQILELITSKPELHHQGRWVKPETDCGTPHCIAGWACELSGMPMRVKVGRPGSYLDETFITIDGTATSLDELDDSGECIDDIARNLLGLTESQARYLFYQFSDDRAVELLRLYIDEAKGA